MYTAEQYAQLALQMSEATYSEKVRQSIIDKLTKQKRDLLALLDEHDINPPKSCQREMQFLRN